MKPVILIATHNRPHITASNIRCLYNQYKSMPTVVVVYTNHEDFDFLRTKFLNLHLVQSPNNPLGSKWQVGVDYCRAIGADPLIILGSDDFLSRNALHNALHMMKYHDFVGFRAWSMYDTIKKQHYLLNYNRNVVYKTFTLGAGRFYSASLLSRFNWQLFDRKLDRNLDNMGHRNVLQFASSPAYIEHFAPDYPWVISFKGHWPCLNDLNNIINSQSIDVNHHPEKAKIIESLYPKNLF